MKRPFLIRAIPVGMRAAVFNRRYKGTSDKFRDLYSGAKLYFAPQVKMNLTPGDVISDEIAFTGAYNARFTRKLIEIARSKGGLFVEVGAHLGYYSLLWCAQRPNNRAIAIEPSPRVFELLGLNIALNGFATRIHCLKKAVSNKAGTEQFDLGPAGQNGWGGFKCCDSAGTVTVTVDTLDEILSWESQSISAMKVSLQGADTWAIQGARNLLSKKLVSHFWWDENRPRMKQLGIPVGEARELLAGFGYKAQSEDDPVHEYWYACPAR
jgi:FkbM family methyltransferase